MCSSDLPLYDAVATMDTVTLVRSGIRGVLKAAAADLGTELRSVIGRDDDYAAAGKPVCDYDDAVARKVLVDALAKDAGDLHRGPPSPARAQDRRPWLRWLQGLMPVSALSLQCRASPPSLLGRVS